MSTLDFSREVIEAIANNPFLEEQEDQSAPPDAAPEGLNAEHEVCATLPAPSTDSDQETMPPTQHIEAEKPPAHSGDYPASGSARSEARRGGKACGSTGRPRWATAHY